MLKSPRATGPATGIGLAAIVLSTALLAGCGSRVQTWPTNHTAHVADEPMRETTSVTKGEILTVRLPTTAGARFAWRMSGDSAVARMLELEQRLDQQNANGRVAFRGEPAWDVFTFRAKRTGHVTVDFVYEHLHSTNDPAARMYVLDVNVVTPEVAAETMASAE